MNYRSDGFLQALLESWGNNSKMNYFRGPTQQFKDSRQQNGTGTLTTDSYWDGPGVCLWVCVWRDGYYKRWSGRPAVLLQDRGKHDGGCPRPRLADHRSSGGLSQTADWAGVPSAD